MGLYPFDQKKLPCQDFLCLLVCFQHQSVFNPNNLGAWSGILHSIWEREPWPFAKEMCLTAWLWQSQGSANGNNFPDLQMNWDSRIS
jgi:hypothetical protein